MIVWATKWAANVRSISSQSITSASFKSGCLGLIISNWSAETSYHSVAQLALNQLKPGEYLQEFDAQLSHFLQIRKQCLGYKD